jgi:trehalose synthase
LVLVGPDVHGVADDPEGAATLAQVVAAWHSFPGPIRRQIQLVSVPMVDIQENAAIVNALQRHAAVVVQKSLCEGFGLTVTEAMWKSRPIVASAVGGIQDQIEDGVHGLLLPDPTDLRAYGRAVCRLLDDRPYAARLGQRAHERVRDHYLGVGHLLLYGRLIERLEAQALRGGLD